MTPPKPFDEEMRAAAEGYAAFEIAGATRCCEQCEGLAKTVFKEKTHYGQRAFLAGARAALKSELVRELVAALEDISNEKTNIEFCRPHAAIALSAYRERTTSEGTDDE